MDSRRKLEFRRCLNRIANHLSRQNFDDLKFMCKDAVPVARMERVRSATDLFQALEERGRLAIDQLDYLAHVLTSVGCGRLLSEFSDSGFQVAIPPGPGQQLLPQGAFNGIGPGTGVQSAEFLFTECLMRIAQQLQAREIETLSFTWAEALLGLSTDKVFSATHLFQLLQQRQIITSTNLRQLYDELHEVGRSDLAGIINEYLDKTGQGRYDIPEEAIGDIRAHPGAQNNFQATPIPEAGAMRTYQHSPYSTMSSSSEETSMGSASLSTVSSSENPSLPSLACTDPEPAHIPLYYVGSQSRPKLHTARSNVSNVATDPSSSRMDTVPSQGGSLIVAGHVHSPVPRESYHNQPQRREAWSDPHNTTSTHTISTGVRSAITQPRMSDEESTPYELSARAGNPYGLTFSEEREEVQRPSFETQQLLTRLAAKENQFSSKEREMRQLSQELEDARRRNEGLIAERVGEAEVYLTSIRELEELLLRKNTEVESLRVELEQLHHDTQALHASRGNVNPDDLYRMDNNPHGICLIINNHKFHHPTDPSKAHPDRGGSEIDQFNLKQTFRYLRYKVEVLENLTSDQMTDTMMAMSQRDHSKFDSFVCCILTHGEADVVHGADSQQVPLKDLTGLMKYSKTLTGKPKMFFIQACRGEAEDKGMQFDDFQKDSGGSKSVIPQGADFFYGYATPPDFAAYRSRRHGSWYISELCKVFTDNAYSSNLSSMMKKVNNNVTKAFTKEGRKQCPEVVDRLRSEVHFFHFIKSKPRQ